MGRAGSSKQATAGQSYRFGYTYDQSGSLASESYPSGRVVNTCYDLANRVSQVGVPACGNAVGAYASNVQYAAHGAPTAYTFGNNVLHEPTYNSRLQMSGFVDQLSGGTAYLNATLNWGTTQNNGNLQGSSFTHLGGAGLSSPLTLTQSYVYDGVNRRNIVTDTGYGRSFAYDEYGNMFVSWFSKNLPPGGNTPTSYVYQSNNQFTTGTYDAAGNETAVNGDTVTYDAESRQTSVVGTGVNETYVYDGDGQRVEKLGYGGSPATVFVYDALGRMAAEYSTAIDMPTCVTCYMSPDHLGTTRLVTDQNGNVVGRHDYLPFGEEILANTAYRNGQWGTGNDSINQKFTGKERDSESGLDYFGARYYGSALGRFTSPDDGSDQDPGNPQSWNLYGYVRNNPLANSDPTGRNCVTFDNGTQGDDGQGTTCAGAHLETKQTANVTAQGGNKLAAFGINLAFALSNVANGAFRFIAPDSELLSNTPTNSEFTGQLATGVAVVGTALIGPGGEASNAINVTKAGLEHVLERHAAGGAKTLGKSLFNAGEDIQGLIKAAESTAPVKQAGGNLERVVDAGRTIGTDRAVGGSTSTYTVITKPNGNLVTAFPGKP
jgi:RHS repeat-associated protein